MVCLGMDEGVNEFCLSNVTISNLGVTKTKDLQDIRFCVCVCVGGVYSMCEYRRAYTWGMESFPRPVWEWKIFMYKYIDERRGQRVSSYTIEGRLRWFFQQGKVILSPVTEAVSSLYELPLTQCPATCCHAKINHECLPFPVTVRTTVTFSKLWQLHCFNHHFMP